MAVAKIRDDVLALAKALRHRDRFVRRHAAATLAGLGPEAGSAIEELGRAVADKDPAIATLSTKALGRIGPEAIPHLTMALAHPAACVRREGVWALKDLGPAALPALPFLVKALRDDDLRVQLGAAQALGAIGPDAVEAVADLAEALRATNLIFCRLAAQGLARIGTASLPVLRELQVQGDHNTRREAAWAVRQIETRHAGSPTEVEEATAHATQVVDCLPARESQARTALIPIARKRPARSPSKG
jgi:HEAT repeat protein